MGKAGTMVPSTMRHKSIYWVLNVAGVHVITLSGMQMQLLISALSSGGEHREESPCGIPEITHEITSQRRLNRWSSELWYCRSLVRSWHHRNLPRNHVRKSGNYRRKNQRGHFAPAVRVFKCDSLICYHKLLCSIPCATEVF